VCCKEISFLCVYLSFFFSLILSSILSFIFCLCTIFSCWFYDICLYVYVRFTELSPSGVFVQCFSCGFYDICLYVYVCFTELNPSGDENVYLDTCNNSCPANLATGSDGKCVLVSNCWNRTHTYSCGSSNCYQRMWNVDIDQVSLFVGYDCDYDTYL
jgi:hypothetical protein